jgi:hypothetical protein
MKIFTLFSRILQNKKLVRNNYPKNFYLSEDTSSVPVMRSTNLRLTPTSQSLLFPWKELYPVGSSQERIA